MLAMVKFGCASFSWVVALVALSCLKPPVQAESGQSTRHPSSRAIGNFRLSKKNSLSKVSGVVANEGGASGSLPEIARSRGLTDYVSPNDLAQLYEYDY